MLHRALPLACLCLAVCVDPTDDAADDLDAAPRSAEPIDPEDCGATNEVLWDLTRAPFGMLADADAAVTAALAVVPDFFEACPNRDLVLYFPPGDWTFDDVLFHPNDVPIDPDRKASIHLEHLRRGPGSSLTLRGAGMDATRLVFAHHRQYGMLFEDTSRIRVEHMHLTRPGLYVSQGTVTQVAAGAVWFRSHQGFPNPADLAAEKNALDNDRTLIRFEGDPLDPRLAPNSVSLKLCAHDTTQCPRAILEVDPANREFKAILADPGLEPDLVPGDRVALKAKVGENTVRAVNSDEFSIVDVRFTRHSAVSLVVEGESARVERVRIERAASLSGRAPFFSGPGGGPQVTATTAGPTIRDCIITATTDDAIAVFSADSSGLDKLMSGAEIAGNVVRDTQGRGINITQSKSGRCHHNHLIRGQNPSIQLKSNQNARNDAAVVGWKIEDNKIEQPWTFPAIYLTVENPLIASGLHDRNEILGNKFIEASRDNPLIQIHQTNRLKISGNVVDSFSTADDVADGDVPSPAPLVLVKAALAVDGVDNRCKVATTRPTVHRANGIPASAVTTQWDCD
jgi:hypothetical protein